MEDFFDYFNEINEELFLSSKNDEFSFSNSIRINNELSIPISFENCNIAILGLDQGDDQNFKDVNLIRESLYKLKRIKNKVNIIDLGNLKKGHSDNDYKAALKYITEILLNHNIIPVIISPNNLTDINFNYSASVITDVSSHINDNLKKISSHILYNIGYQSYFVSPDEIDSLNKEGIFAVRLGEIRNKISSIEPLLRDSDIININLDSIKLSEAPGQKLGSPNGLYSEEVCQIARYAGLSNQCKTYNITGYCSEKDHNNQTASLCAQLIWYLLDGISSRIDENITGERKNFKKYIVSLHEGEYNIVYYRSDITGRWWYEVPSNKKGENGASIFACTLSDYEKACANEVPKRWLNLYKRLN